MKGIIIKKNRISSIVMTEDGNFIKIKSKEDHIIGSEVQMSKQVKISIRRMVLIAAAIILCFSFATFAVANNMTAYTVYVDVNPSISLKVNAFDVITSIQALNEDAEEIEGLDHIVGMKFNEGIMELVDILQESGYLEDDGVVVLSVEGNDGKVRSIEKHFELFTEDEDYEDYDLADEDSDDEDNDDEDNDDEDNDDEDNDDEDNDDEDNDDEDNDDEDNDDEDNDDEDNDDEDSDDEDNDDEDNDDEDNDNEESKNSRKIRFVVGRITKEMFAKAEELNVPVGRILLITKAIESGAALEYEDAVDLSVQEIQRINKINSDIQKVEALMNQEQERNNGTDNVIKNINKNIVKNAERLREEAEKLQKQIENNPNENLQKKYVLIQNELEKVDTVEAEYLVKITGKPADTGKADDKGKPEETGKADDKGKPEETGKADDKGKPEETGKPAEKENPENPRKPVNTENTANNNGNSNNTNNGNNGNSGNNGNNGNSGKGK